MPEFEKGKSIPKARANFLIRLGSVKQLSYYPHRTECVSNITHSNNTSQRHTVATIYSYTQLSLMQFCLRFRFTINLTYTSENTDLSRHIQLTDKNFPAFFNVVIPRDSSPDISDLTFTLQQCVLSRVAPRRVCLQASAWSQGLFFLTTHQAPGLVMGIAFCVLHVQT